MSSDRAPRMRSGLPRAKGGGPWPPGGMTSGGTTGGGSPGAEPDSAVAAAPAPSVEALAGKAVVDAAGGVVSAPRGALRRGLPRAPGGESWPPAGEAPPASGFVAEVATGAAGSLAPPAPASDEPVTDVSSVRTGIALRRGLPRAAGGDPWPAEGRAPAGTVDTSPRGGAAAVTPLEIATEASAPATPAPEPEIEAAMPAQAAVAPPAPAVPVPSEPEPRMIGSRSPARWAKLGAGGLVGAVVVAGVIVLAARGVTTLPGVPGFLARFPGEYHPPFAADEGFPVWARWTHFLNFFFMVLIVRTGLLVRYQQKPPAFYTPKKGGKKISLYLWLHTSVDLLWLLNGAVFVVLLFATNHWVRIVPTSWEVFPNALSAGLQYLTLEWPTENGWVNYNSLQQLMYFAVVFIAAPLAAVTGVRMSEWWPERAKRLNRLYPAPLARMIHFPVMLFFVLFVIVHVFLVLATGALRNLNHMFAGSDQVNWVGFWWFVAALFSAAVVTWLARPLVIAPIARVFGRVSNR